MFTTRPGWPAPSGWSPPPTGWPARPAWRPSRPATRSMPRSLRVSPCRSSSRTSTAPGARSPCSSPGRATRGPSSSPGRAPPPPAPRSRPTATAGSRPRPGHRSPGRHRPGAIGAWLTLLRDHGTLPLDAVLRFAIEYAEHGHPLLPRVAATVASVSEHFRTHWPTSAATWLAPDGAPPAAGRLFRNPVLASTYRRLLDAARGPSREAQIDAALAAWYTGFVAEAIDEFSRSPVMDDSGRPPSRLPHRARSRRLAADVRAAGHADWRGWTLAKAGPWSQGPALLQALAMLDGAGEVPGPGTLGTAEPTWSTPASRR